MDTPVRLRRVPRHRRALGAVSLTLALLASFFAFSFASPADAGGNNNGVKKCYENVDVTKHRWTRSFGGEKEVKGWQHVGPGNGKNGTEWKQADSSTWYVIPASLNPPSMGQVNRTGTVNLNSYKGPNQMVSYRYPDTGVSWFPSEHGWATQEEFNQGATGYSWTLHDTKTFTKKVEVDCPEDPNLCDPDQRPAGMSVKEWHRANQFDGSTCFDHEVVQACGSLNVLFTRNDTGLTYSFRWAEGAAVTDDHNGDGGFPVTWPEDYSGGSVDVTFWVVGPEGDFFTGSTFPNWWDRKGETVSVDTDCERTPPPVITTPTTGPTTTSSATTSSTTTTSTTSSTTTTEPVEVGGITETTEDSGQLSAGGTGGTGAGQLPRTGAGMGGLLLVAALLTGLGTVLRSSSRHLR